MQPSLQALKKQGRAGWILIDWRAGNVAAAAAVNGPNLWHLRLRAGDVLADDALHRLARFVQERPDALVVYTDHDFIDSAGRRHSPVFKPAWNPDLFFTHNYLANLCAVSARLPGASEIFTRRSTTEELVSLVLAASRSKAVEPIVHLPQVLCHRHADASHADPYGGEPAEPRALAAHPPLAAVSIEPGMRPHTVRVVWPLPDPVPHVTVIIPTRDRIDLLRACVDSVVQVTAYANFDVVIVDNDSQTTEAARYFEGIAGDPRVRVLPFPGPFNYSAINNAAAGRAGGELLAFLNNDTEVISPDWMSDMARQAMRPGVGAVGAKLLYTDGTVQHAGVVLGIGGVAGHVHRFLPGDEPGYCGRAELTHSFTAVTAACLMVRKKLFESVGGFNATSLVVAFNDVDLCLRLHRMGLRNIFEARALLHHHESMSRGVDDTDEKRRVFERERTYMLQHWQREIADDPAYNLNLSREQEDFSFRIGAATERQLRRA